MPIPDRVAGTRPPRNPNNPPKGDKHNPKPNSKGQKGSSTPGSHGPRGEEGASATFNGEPLNPPFDPRMRRIGSPLNLTTRIKRGWIQRKGDGTRVDFLYNPSELNLSHQTFDMSRSTKQVPTNDVMDPNYPTIGSTTGVKLLYDRTYELFSPPKHGKAGFANEYGVWADVAAWYVFLGMLPAMPTSWEDSVITDPPQYNLAYLFVGGKMLYHGWVTSLDVVYSHWSQDMVPARCAIDIGFQILPITGSIDLSSVQDFFTGVNPLAGWLGSDKTDAPEAPFIPNSPTVMPGP